MKKFYLALVVMFMGVFSAQAIDYYLIGGFNGWTLKDSRCKFVESSTSGVYTLDLPDGLPLTSGFKINDGTWSNGNANFGAGGTLTVGQTYNLNLNSSSGDINFAVSGTTVPNAHITFNPSAKTLLVEGKQEAAKTVYGIHTNIFGESSWATYDMTEGSDGKWTLTKEATVAGEFGIKAMNSITGAQTDWYAATSAADAAIVVGKTVTCGTSGTTNFSIATGSYTFTFDPSTKQLTVTGTSTGETPEPNPYSAYWVHVGGTFNGKNFYDNGMQPNDEGIATFSNLAIGTSDFKVHVWDGSNDIYYINDGDTTVPTGQWVQFVQDGYDIYDYIAGATATSVYNIQYNVATNQIYIEVVGGDTPVIPTVKDLELIGSFNSWGDTGTIPMTYNEESKEYTATVASWEGGTQFKIREVGSWGYTFGGDAGGEDVESVLAVVGDNTVWEGSSVNLEVPSTGWNNMSFVFTYEGNKGSLKISASSMVEGVVVDNNVAPVYYNLQGVRVDNPTNGLYIVVRGNEVSKQVIR